MCKVSVIIPVYNADKYLRKCLDSLLAQTLKDIEIIIVNDGSTDNSESIINEYVSAYQNIKYLFQNNSGPSVARNAGIHIASGEYIGFVDSDDYISPDMYSVLYQIAAENNVDIVTSDYYITNCGQIISTSHFSIPANQIIDQSGISELVRDANHSRLLWFGGKGIYKNTVIKDNGIVYPQLNLGEETVFILDFLLSSKSMYYVDRPFYYYEQSPDSLTRTKYKERLLSQLEELYNNKISIYDKHKYSSYREDLTQYTMKHTIPMLISNELNSQDSFYKRVLSYRAIRNSDMVNYAYKNSSVKLIRSKLKYIAFLLKLRAYFILAIL